MSSQNSPPPRGLPSFLARGLESLADDADALSAAVAAAADAAVFHDDDDEALESEGPRISDESPTRSRSNTRGPNSANIHNNNVNADAGTSAGHDYHHRGHHASASGAGDVVTSFSDAAVAQHASRPHHHAHGDSIVSNATSVRTSLSLNAEMLSMSRGPLRTHSDASDGAGVAVSPCRRDSLERVSRGGGFGGGAGGRPLGMMLSFNNAGAEDSCDFDTGSVSDPSAFPSGHALLQAAANADDLPPMAPRRKSRSEQQRSATQAEFRGWEWCGATSASASATPDRRHSVSGGTPGAAGVALMLDACTVASGDFTSDAAADVDTVLQQSSTFTQRSLTHALRGAATATGPSALSLSSTTATGNSSLNPSATREILIMSYNILAQRYVTSDKYGEYCPPHALEQSYRVKNVARQIACAAPQILMMQEVATSLARPQSELRSLLRDAGLSEMMHVPVTFPDGMDRFGGASTGGGNDDRHHRPHSGPCSADSTHSLLNESTSISYIEGVAVAWNPVRFTALRQTTVRFNRLVDDIAGLEEHERTLLQKGSHNVAALVALRDRCVDRSVVIVACVHVYYDHSRRECQLWQLAKLTAAVAEMRADVVSEHPGFRVHVVLGGDFNCDAAEFPIAFVETGRVEIPVGRLPLSPVSGAAAAAAPAATAMPTFLRGLDSYDALSSGLPSVTKAAAALARASYATMSSLVPTASAMESANDSATGMPCELSDSSRTSAPPFCMDETVCMETSPANCVPPTPKRRGAKGAPRAHVQAPNIFVDCQRATHDLRLTSGYRDYAALHPEHVSAHDVQTGFAGLIDHIFYQPDAYRLTRVGQIMRSAWAVPNEREPSDHVPVCVGIEPLFM